jgi:CDP-6-deoxy-D-xylo-4-hexulose-3-dehydrase
MIKLIPENQHIEDNKIVEDFIKTNPLQLSQGEKVRELEKEFARYIGIGHAVYCNSGSSANLLMVSAAREAGMLKNNTVVLPALSWATTVSPWLQLGFDIVLCDADRDNLGMDIVDLETIMEKENPASVMPVHVLGMPAHIETIKNMCSKSGAVLLEDCCESLGSEVAEKKLGTFGAMATYSCYVGHHLSTIEGGFVVTDDKELSDILKMLRSHGWNKDIQNYKYENIDSFQDKFNFYLPGYNLRSQEINAAIGIEKMKTIGYEIAKRNTLFNYYQEKVIGKYWKPKPAGYVSAMAYPVIHFNKREIAEELKNNDIECRPLIAGSMEYQPMIVKRYGFKERCPFATLIHKYGMYVPLHPKLEYDEIDKIIEIINKEYPTHINGVF